MKWPAHRTNINQTLTIAKQDSTMQAIISSGLKNGTSTVDILQSIISIKVAENMLLMQKLEELNAAALAHLEREA